MSRFLQWVLMIIFLTAGVCPARAAGYVLPDPGAMAFPDVTGRPAILMGMRIYPEDPFRMDFLVEHASGQAPSRDISERLIKYFLAAFTVPEKEMWVNLSPYEPERIIAAGLGRTVLGHDMLLQDRALKQLSASLMHPDSATGKEFWRRVYARVRAKYGNSDVLPETFHKVWIVPQDAAVFVRGDRVYVVRARLKALLEEDRAAARAANGGNIAPDDGNITTETQREVILPEIEREINEGAVFAPLRQIYHAMVLATWYKRHLKSSFLTRVYSARNRTSGLENAAGADDPRALWEKYAAAFRKGAADLIREEADPVTGDIVARHYFTGGLEGVGPIATLLQPPPGWARERNGIGHAVLETRLLAETSAAMAGETMIARAKTLLEAPLPRPLPGAVAGLSHGDILRAAAALGYPVDARMSEWLALHQKALPLIEGRVKVLLETYEKRRPVYVCMGRDAEIFADIFRTLGRGADLEDRVALVNISIPVMNLFRFPHQDRDTGEIRRILERQGITKEALERGQIVLIDSGFAGSAFDFIGRILGVDPSVFRPQGRLVASAGGYPAMDIVAQDAARETAFRADVRGYYGAMSPFAEHHYNDQGLPLAYHLQQIPKYHAAAAVIENGDLLPAADQRRYQPRTLTDENRRLNTNPSAVDPVGAMLFQRDTVAYFAGEAVRAEFADVLQARPRTGGSAVSTRERDALLTRLREANGGGPYAFQPGGVDGIDIIRDNRAAALSDLFRAEPALNTVVYLGSDFYDDPRYPARIGADLSLIAAKRFWEARGKRVILLSAGSVPVPEEAGLAADILQIGQGIEASRALLRYIKKAIDWRVAELSIEGKGADAGRSVMIPTGDAGRIAFLASLEGALRDDDGKDALQDLRAVAGRWRSGVIVSGEPEGMPDRFQASFGVMEGDLQVVDIYTLQGGLVRQTYQNKAWSREDLRPPGDPDAGALGLTGGEAALHKTGEGVWQWRGAAPVDPGGIDLSAAGLEIDASGAASVPETGGNTAAYARALRGLCPLILGIHPADNSAFDAF